MLLNTHLEILVLFLESPDQLFALSVGLQSLLLPSQFLDLLTHLSDMLHTLVSLFLKFLLESD